MPRTFAYVRVSTTGQTTENQLQEIEAAGFQVELRRIVTETVSGSTAIAQRRGFSRLMDKLESGDILASRHESGESVRLLRTYPELRLV